MAHTQVAAASILVAEDDPAVAAELKDVLALDGYDVDVDARLTPTEYRLMSHPVTRADEVVTKKDLADAVWGAYDPGIRRTLNVHVRRLRAKLRPGPTDAPCVETVRGFGYRLTRGSNRI